MGSPKSMQAGTANSLSSNKDFGFGMVDGKELQRYNHSYGIIVVDRFFCEGQVFTFAKEALLT
jgi:hypothetical protein